MNDPKIIAGFSIISFLVAGIIIFQLLDYAAFKDALQQAGEKPAEVVIAICAFLIAFILRAIAWKKVLPSMTLGQSLAGIHLSLGANHVLPLRLGEPLRVLSITKRSDISLDAATASTLTLRSADYFVFNRDRSDYCSISPFLTFVWLVWLASYRSGTSDRYRIMEMVEGNSQKK